MNQAQHISSPPDVCPLCEGTGWKPLSQGNIRRVTRCDCRLHARSLSLLDAARIPKRYEHCELAKFECHGKTRLLESARQVAYAFVREYPLDATGLVLSGRIGVGKTHLAVGIIKELIQSKGIHCLFYDYRELLKEIQNSYNSSTQATELDVLRPVFETEVLVIDELGAIKPSEWVRDTVSVILNSRYNEKRTTIITTNLEYKAEHDAEPGVSNRARAIQAMRDDTLGDRIGEAMRSRLREMCRIIQLQGDDFRQTMTPPSLR